MLQINCGEIDKMEPMTKDERKAWVEPVVQTLDVSETAIFAFTGPDGGFQGRHDCSKS